MKSFYIPALTAVIVFLTVFPPITQAHNWDDFTSYNDSQGSIKGDTRKQTRDTHPRYHQAGMGMNFGFGKYSVGLFGYWTGPLRLGVFAEFTGSDVTKSKDNFYDNINVIRAEETFGDERQSEKTAIDEVTLYVGRAAVTSETYYEYYDSLYILSSSGSYWIDPNVTTKSTCNTFGTIITAYKNPHIQAGIQAGYYTAPVFFEIGAFMSFIF